LAFTTLIYLGLTVFTPQNLTESKKHQENSNTQIVALRKSPSIIRPLKAVAMAAAFAFYAINLPILNKFS
jgi:hypothetical protein